MENSKPPLIIEAALNGGTPKTRLVHTPRQSQEIFDDAIACLEAGAGVIHTHNPDITLTGDAAADSYRLAWDPILARRPDTILYSTVALADAVEERFGHYRQLARYGMTMGAIDPGSVNIATHGADGLPGAYSRVYQTSYPDIAALMALLDAAKLGPSIAIYEPGFLRTVLAYKRAGKLPAGAFVKFYFGGEYNFLDGQRSNVTFGLPPTRKALDAYLEMLDGSALPWAVAVPGGCVVDTGMARLAIERGGHVRVGLEDYAGPDQPDNRTLVEQIVAIAGELGRPIATPAQTRALLGLRRQPGSV